MKKLRDFLCANCGTFERLVKDKQSSLVCKCGDNAYRLVSTPKCFQNTTGKSPSASNKK
jgi:hypothetical protein